MLIKLNSQILIIKINIEFAEAKSDVLLGLTREDDFFVNRCYLFTRGPRVVHNVGESRYSGDTCTHDIQSSQEFVATNYASLYGDQSKSEYRSIQARRRAQSSKPHC